MRPCRSPHSLSRQAFDPETVEVLSSAFEKVCAELRLSRREDRLTEIVARQVIEAAQTCMRDENAIRLVVLREIQAPH